MVKKYCDKSTVKLSDNMLLLFPEEEICHEYLVLEWNRMRIIMII